MSISKINYLEDLERLQTIKEKIKFLFERYEKLTKVDIQKHLKISHQTATGQLARLQDEGIIKLTGSKRTRKGHLIGIYKLTTDDEKEVMINARENEKKNRILRRLLKMNISDELRIQIAKEIEL